MVAVSTAVGSVHDVDGIDVDRLVKLRAESGDDCVREYGQMLPAEAALTVDTDILIPAAREDVIDDEVAHTTTARLVVEGASLPTTSTALTILHKRAIVTVPDFIANAGGIVAAAHSMDARYSAFPVEPAVVFSMISTKLRANAQTVLAASKERGITPHEAAHNLTEERVLKAMVLRGQVAADDIGAVL